MDNYLIGTNPAMTCLFWGGNTNGENMEQGTFGTTALGPHWKKMMEFVFQKHPWMNEKFVKPAGVESFQNSWKRIGQSVKKFEKIPGMSYVSSKEKKPVDANESGLENFIKERLDAFFLDNSTR